MNMVDNLSGPMASIASRVGADVSKMDALGATFGNVAKSGAVMQEIIIIAPTKETAREWLAKIRQFIKEKLHLDLNSKTKIFYTRQGVNAYGYKIKATHLELRTTSKRKEKRRVKAMIAKLREGKKTRKEIQQEVNSWLGFARWASAYNLAKKIFAPYRFIQVEGVLPYGAISRNRAARRVLQQRNNP